MPFIVSDLLYMLLQMYALDIVFRLEMRELYHMHNIVDPVFRSLE